MYLVILLPSLLALFALYKKKITNGGIIAAWLMGIIITYVGGLYAFSALASTFLLTILSDKIKRHHRDEKRNIYQIISNVLTATMALVIYSFKGEEIFIVMYYAVLAGSLSDTLASSIGSLSRHRSFNPVTFKRMRKGESGAISTLGLSATLLGGLVIGGIYYLNGGDVTNYLIIIIMGVIGAYLDSIMGAFVQGKYKCSKCKEVVETNSHCGKKTKLVRGLVFVNNDVVNLLSNIFVFIITYIIMILK